ncbi:hypothetical protein ACFU6M_40770 [Streptomyces bottropensis]|uniref:hypothetical protein n=1 Tax=Streptomyces bottropensis TaxID=42235 RepID=UPI0036A94964
MIVLAELRHDQRLADMAGGNDVSESTVRRRRDELIRLLADQTPRLDRALRKVTKQGEEVVSSTAPSSLPSAAPAKPTGETTPAKTTITACTSLP